MSKICVVGLGGYSVFMNTHHFNENGETVKADKLFVEAGGKGYNQAVAAARLGAEVSFLGAFGKDSEGEFCIDYLKQENITPLSVYKELPTAYACIITDASGENRVTVYGGAAAQLNREDVKQFKDHISSCDILVLQNEVPAEANLAATEIAKEYGVKVIVNPAPSVGINTKLIECADVITPNEYEYKDIFGNKMTKKAAVVTLGGNGCAVLMNDTVEYIEAVKVKAVDTTGAGDCFTGALAVGLAEKMSLYKAAEFASKAAAVAVTKAGAVGAMPHRNEV